MADIFNQLTQFDSSGMPIFNSTLPTDTGTNESKESIRPFIDNTFRQGIARTNRYAIEFMNSNGMTREDTARLLLSAEVAVMPGRSFSTMDNVRIGGYYTPYPYVRTYANTLTIIFRVGSDMFERLLFDVWQDEIMNPITQNFNYPDNYTNNIRIHQLDGQNNKVYTTEIEYAYPKEIGDLNLNMEEQAMYHKQTIIFAYKKHSVLGWNDLESWKQSYGISESSFQGDTPQLFGLNGELVLGNSIHRQPLEEGPSQKRYTGILGVLDKIARNREDIKNISNRIRTYNKGLGNPLGRGANEILKSIEGFPTIKSL